MPASAIIQTPLLTLYVETDGEGISLLRPAKPSDAPCGESALISVAEAWLRDYFSGSRILPPIPPLSLAGTPFCQKVWNALLGIQYGKTVTYGQIAKMVGCASARAIGGAVGANPVMIMVPCHRVVASDGIGGYAYGTEIKRNLLSLENESNT